MKKIICFIIVVTQLFAQNDFDIESIINPFGNPFTPPDRNNQQQQQQQQQQSQQQSSGDVKIPRAPSNIT